MIDSEPLWHRAETEVFGGLGIELSIFRGSRKRIRLCIRNVAARSVQC